MKSNTHNFKDKKCKKDRRPMRDRYIDTRKVLHKILRRRS